MTQRQTAQYGSWRSPITSDLIVAGTVGLGAVSFDGDAIYWLEGRPAEKGRNVLVRRSATGEVTDITPAPFNVRTRVHEYGGGSFLITDNTVYFVNFADQRLYYHQIGETPQPLTAASALRYADMILDKQHNRLICVGEDHSIPDREPENYLVSVDLSSGAVTILTSGADFYSSPRLSPDGSQLAWLCWYHPNLPWDSTELWVATLEADGLLGNITLIAGGESESIVQPEWSPDGKLYFVSDRTNWWNLYRLDDQGEIEPLSQVNAEFGYPHWVFGESMYGFASESTLICIYNQQGSSYLGSINTNTKRLKAITSSYTDISYLQVKSDHIAFIGGSPTLPTAIVTLDLQTNKITRLKAASDLELDNGYLSIPQPIAFPTSNGLIAYAWYYPPTNKDYQAPEGELPPLLVKSHGGPTASASASYSLRVQYWTSRGFGLVDVNYGGSTGYGREYRQRLNYNWGIVDVDDCVNAAQYLVREGYVDGNRLAIAGSSAGGYTTLAALTFRNVFKAGASYYGISNLEALAQDTHKFESRYLDQLIGKYPEDQAIYQARSPINYTENLSCPVIFFQGLEDQVVPPNQAEMMVNALIAKGLPVAYITFEGEQHGFRQADNIKRAIDSEFYFYSRIFGFKPADNLTPVEIINL